jgi:cation diffusion facilitator family transporter
MIRFLANIFIRNKEEKEQRQAYGVLCGMIGVALNICLFVGKFMAGLISNSIAITADAFNNLSDAGSSFVTLVGFKLAGTKPDPQHPFGHGRIEYLSGLIVSGAILIMAYELVRDSVNKIIHPQETTFSMVATFILLASIAVKLYMSYYNRTIGDKISSTAMRATAIDSLSDACATTVVLISTLIGKYTGLKLDGYFGVMVGLFIFYAGINAARETVNPLLGQSPEPEFVDRITGIVMKQELICGIHDLVVHDYGPGRIMISLHAEVPADGDILKIHDVIDNCEEELRRELGCDSVIHMDPIVTNDPQITTLKQQMKSILAEIDEGLNLHDFRVVKGVTHTNLIFDIVVAYSYHLSDEELIKLVNTKSKEYLGAEYILVIKVDKAYS